MYSTILMLALSGSSTVPEGINIDATALTVEAIPEGILFNRGAGCGGQATRAVFVVQRERRAIFPLFHRRSRGGCSGSVQSYGGCGGASAQGVYVESNYKYQRMPVGSVAPVPEKVTAPESKVPPPPAPTFSSPPPGQQAPTPPTNPKRRPTR